MITTEARHDAPFGLLGRTLAHSWSPSIHQRLGSAPYALFEREPDEVEAFIRAGTWRGLNVTIPYKLEAARLADETSPHVRRTGAANTLLRRDDGSVFADNTDVAGFLWLLERFARRELTCEATEAFGGKKALVLGSGGASKAIVAALEDGAGAEVVTISRSGPVGYADIGRAHADAALVVNATPVGMYPDCPATPLGIPVLEALPQLRAVIDVVYNPERTGICLAAERLGIPSESGLAMLVGQAACSSALWLGQKADEAIVGDIERDLRRDMRNVVLVGMPGCGKTGAGRRLARNVGRPFVDLDDAFELEYGIGADECIRTQGEAEFRRRETAVAASYGRRSGLVIACGGGIVTRPENYELLHQNATIVFVNRPLEQLSADGRPLSQRYGVERLARERMPLYRAWADVTLPCTGSAEGDALAIARLLGLSGNGEEVIPNDT